MQNMEEVYLLCLYLCKNCYKSFGAGKTFYFILNSLNYVFTNYN